MRVRSTTGASGVSRTQVNPPTSETELEKIGQLSSPFPACEALKLVDSESYKKNESRWRQVSLGSDFKGPIELVPSTSMFKSFDGQSANKPGSMSPTQFLESVGQRAVYDLNSGLEQYRDLKKCVAENTNSVICEKLKDGFKRGFEKSGPALRNALARSAFVDSLYVSRAIAMNDPSDFVNSRMDIKKAGVFGATPHRALSGEELSAARADVRQAFANAKKDYYEMVEARLAERQKEGAWTKDIIDRERLTMTSPQALSAAIGSRMADYRAARVADYYRAMTNSPQLAYSVSVPQSDREMMKILDRMIADGESQLKKTKETLAGAKASSQSNSRSRGKLTDHHLKLAGYSSTVEKVLQDEAMQSKPQGRPMHCGLAVGLHNELLASQSADGLLIAGALITAPIGAAIAVPRLAMAIGAGSLASGAGLSSVVVGTGISSGLLSAGRDVAIAQSALSEVRTGLRTADDARAAVSAGNMAAIGVATSVALGIKPSLVAVGRSSANASKVTHVAAKVKFPPAIQETVGQTIRGKVMDVSRLRTSLKLLKANDKSAADSLSKLEDGIYIYGIDRKGNVGMIPRNLDPGGSIDETSTFIGSHLGLRAAMKDAVGGEVDFVSAGEVIVRNGRTMAVTNGAGSFKNGTEHLEFGVEQLKQRGLKVDGRTEIRDFSNKNNFYEDPHDAVSDQIPREIKVARDPVLRDLHKETSGLVARVDAQGVATGDEFFERALGLEGIDSTAAYHAASVYRRWQNPAEGTAYSFEGIYSHIGPEKYREALQVIRRVAGDQ
ncbi:MAG: hypothetical protein U1E10_17910 [Bdellovibrionales bacterium]|nr:hypothetical protein [Bdellovibrionales bacterium]